MTYQLSKSSKNNRAGVDYRLIEISDLAITLTDVDFGHPKLSGLRDASQQKLLYLDGKSQCDGEVNISKHQLGKALDFYAFVDGKASWDIVHLSAVACAMFQAAMILGYRIQWGGLWKNFKDYPHIELID